MSVRTQIGGKYDASDSTLFTLKQRLKNAGVEVTHPLLDQIVTTVEGRGYAFDLTKTSFLEVEIDYYNSIETCDFHIVNNRFHDNLGYLGGSASLEIAYAMLKCKPIVLMHPPHFTKSTLPLAIDLLTKKQHLLYVYDLSIMNTEAIKRVISFLKCQKIDYGLSNAMKDSIIAQVNHLLKEIGKQY